MTQQVVAAYRLEIKIKNGRMAHRQQYGFDGVNMKVLLILLTSLFSIAILLIAGFQLIRLLANKLTEMAEEAWRSPKMQSFH